MFGMGMPEILLILAIALIVLGPKKLPEIAKALGRGIAEFKKATQDFKTSLEADNDLKEAKDSLREIKGDIEGTVRQSMAQGAKLANQEQEDDDEGEEDGDEDAEAQKSRPASENPSSENAVTDSASEPQDEGSKDQAKSKEPAQNAR
jgi:sec-independent protein translocase protein TatB